VRVDEPREEFRRRHGVNTGDVLLALLPGSREAEVALLLPEIMGAVRRLEKEYPLKVFLLKAQNIAPDSLAAAGAGIRICTRSRASTCSTPPTPSSPPAARPTWRRPCSGSLLSSTASIA
jgi:hypothetical protein